MWEQWELALEQEFYVPRSFLLDEVKPKSAKPEKIEFLEDLAWPHAVSDFSCTGSVKGADYRGDPVQSAERHYEVSYTQYLNRLRKVHEMASATSFPKYDQIIVFLWSPEQEDIRFYVSYAFHIF